ncbi:MAG: cytosine permease [Alicyclobacillus sp.]|nr:cytosine permease [Alicyclobacillus sp.]
MGPLSPVPKGGITTANVELNGINVIREEERKGSPRDLFWPWFAGNIGVLGLSYGAFLLGFQISFWQAAVGGLVGIVLSFLLVGFIAVAGKRGSAPTMVLSRAAFGVRNKIPALLSWILCVGWETVIAALAVEATATVFGRLHWGSGVLVKIVALLVVVLLIIAGGVMGFDVLMKIQGVITVITGILTIGFILLTVHQIRWSAVLSLKAGTAEDVIGGLILVFSGFGLGWVNMGADYSRYLPRKVSSAAVVGWTTFAASIGPAVLLIFGLLLAGSSPSLSTPVSANPIGALAALLPTWFLIPYVVVAVLGLVAIGALGGMLVVPMNALLQYRGHRLLQPGQSIAIQGFNENASVLVMVGGLALAMRADWPLVPLLSALGLTMALGLALLWRITRRWQADRPTTATT